MCLDGELGAADTVVFLGDYIDRGPDSKGCIDRILRFRAESRASVVALLGNHEDSLLRTLDDPHRYSWLTVMQGFATVESSGCPIGASFNRRGLPSHGSTSPLVHFLMACRLSPGFPPSLNLRRDHAVPF
jgi:Calcineurin-like phosphoesterase